MTMYTTVDVHDDDHVIQQQTFTTMTMYTTVDVHNDDHVYNSRRSR